MHLIFVELGYPQKLFNLEHFPIYSMYVCMSICVCVCACAYVFVCVHVSVCVCVY